MRKENKLVKQMIILVNTYGRVRRLHRACPITPFIMRTMHGCNISGDGSSMRRTIHRMVGVEGGYVRNIVRGG